MGVFRPRNHFAGALLAGAPIVGALLVALSRMADYRHDVWDVTAGSLLGMSVAWFSYRRYFRGLRSGKCDLPYPSRKDVARKEVGHGKKDVEQQRLKDADEFELDDLASSDEDESRPLTSSSVDKGKSIERG